MEKLTKKEKAKALENFFGISPEEAEAELEDMGEMTYGEREHKPEGGTKCE